METTADFRDARMAMVRWIKSFCRKSYMSVDRNRQTMPFLTTRLCFFALSFFPVIGAQTVGGPALSVALDTLPRSPRVGASHIPLRSYERIPIGKLRSDPASYHLRQIRIAGSVHAIQTQVMTRGCGVPYELTIFSLEDESGLMDVIDKGACGTNRSVVRAPMLVAGDRIDLLVQVVGGTRTEELGSSPEVNVLWIDRAQD